MRRTRPYVYATAAFYLLDRLIRLFRDVSTVANTTLVRVKGSHKNSSVLQVRIPKRRGLRHITPSHVRWRRTMLFARHACSWLTKNGAGVGSPSGHAIFFYSPGGFGQPGQFVVLYLPGAGVLEAHPFSLTSAPSDEYYEVHIRGLGDFTEALLAMQSQRYAVPRLLATVEGPYGAIHLPYSSYAALTFIAGGIGTLNSARFGSGTFFGAI